MSKSLPDHLEYLQDPTISQTAQIIQASSATVWRLCKKGLLKKYRIGGGARIRRESIEALRDGENPKSITK